MKQSQEMRILSQKLINNATSEQDNGHFVHFVLSVSGWVVDLSGSNGAVEHPQWAVVDEGLQALLYFFFFTTWRLQEC